MFIAAVPLRTFSPSFPPLQSHTTNSIMHCCSQMFGSGQGQTYISRNPTCISVSIYIDILAIVHICYYMSPLVIISDSLLTSLTFLYKTWLMRMQAWSSAVVSF